MTIIFQDKGDVAIFFALVIFTFTEFIVGTVNLNIYTRHREWFHAVGEQIKGMPHPFLMPIVWVATYILIVLSMFSFYRNVVFPDATGYMIDAVTILFIYNIMAVKFWPYVFFEARRTTGAMLLILFVVASGIAIDVIFAVNAKWPEFGVFLPYVLWCCYLVYLNGAWIYVEQHTLPIKSTEPL